MQNEQGQRVHDILVIAVCYLSIAMLGIYITTYQYTVLSFTQFYSLNDGMMGFLIFMQHLGISLPPLFLGVLSGKIGKKRVVMISFVLMILGTCLIGTTEPLALFVISVFIIGAGFSVTEATLSAVLADEFPGKSTLHLNFSQVMFSIGALCGPFIAKALIDSGLAFRHIYVGISVVFLVLGIVFAFTKQKNDHVVEQQKGSSIRVTSIFRYGFVLLAICICIYVGIENTIASYADRYFELGLNMPEYSAIALALYWGAMIPSRFLAGIIKIDPKKMIVGLCGLVALAAPAAILIDDAKIKIAMFALCGFACGPLWPSIVDAVAKRNQGQSGPAINVLMSFSGLGGAVFPLAAGLLISYGNISTAYYMCAILSVILGVLYLSSMRKKDIGQGQRKQ